MQWVALQERNPNVEEPESFIVGGILRDLCMARGRGGGGDVDKILFILESKQLALCSEGRYYLCFTKLSVLEKTAPSKGSQCLCSQDMQACKNTMENCLPTPRSFSSWTCVTFY